MSLFVKFLSGLSGEPSSKRLAVFIALFVLVTGYFIAQLTGKAAPEYMWTSFVSIVLIGLGLVTSEQFANRNKS